MLHQIQQQLSAENQAPRAFQIGQHALGVDEHCVNQVGGLLQQIIHQRSGVGNNDPLG